MLWSKKVNKSKSLGVFSSFGKTAIAVVAGAQDSCPRVSNCTLLSSEQTVSDFVDENNLQNSVCVDVLPSNNYNLMQVDLQGVKSDEKREAVRWQIRELLDYPAEEAIIDLLDVPLIGETDAVKNFVVASPKSALKARVEELTASELHIDAIDVPEMVLRNLLELYPDEPRGLGLLWIREQSGLMIICRGDALFFSRVINVGMDQLQISNGTTEENFLSENTQSLLDGIVLEVQRSLDYCESSFRLPPVPKILLALCGEESAEVLDYLDRYLQPDIVSADFRQVLDLPLEIDPATINACLPALGAALRAGGRS